MMDYYIRLYSLNVLSQSKNIEISSVMGELVGSYQEVNLNKWNPRNRCYFNYCNIQAFPTYGRNIREIKIVKKVTKIIWVNKQYQI